MGSASSKTENNEALSLCKERKRFIKRAIESRYALAASHVCYIQSLRDIGIALRRYAEADVLIESSLSTSATELGIDKTLSHSSFPSPCPSQLAEVLDSPVGNGSPLSPPVGPIGTLSYMRLGFSPALTFGVRPGATSYVEEEESITFPMPPPPPPHSHQRLPSHHVLGSSWDFFDTNDDVESFRFVGTSGLDFNVDDVKGWREFKGEGGGGGDVRGRWPENVGLDGNYEVREGYISPKREQKTSDLSNNYVQSCVAENANGLVKSLKESAAVQKCDSSTEKKMVMKKDVCTAREDPSEFITHRAKDFLLSMKDIDHRFLRASASGKEVSRMLEANKIRVGYLEEDGRLSSLAFLDPFRLVCCPGENGLVSHGPPRTKVITWKRSTSSRSSSSSKNPLTAAPKEDVDDNGSDFVEDFCMIAGSHSATLDRLYAWERKLHDEVKASESIWEEYDKKCNQLRYLFAKDYSMQVIDKTRAVVKDLHSRIRVAIYSVDSISKRIEKMRDEELHPQLLELIQELIRMWMAMLECHHAQYITISLAYHSRSSSNGTPQGDAHRQIVAQLQYEIECFGLSFANWINSHASYVDALNGWLQNCILQPREQSRSRRPFSPRRAVAPPIFVLCRDWLSGIKDLPSNELNEAIKTFSSDLNCLMSRQAELQRKQKIDSGDNGEDEGKDNDASSTNLCCIHTSLTKVLDRLTKFSEASLKMYEQIKQRSEVARVAYSSYRPARY